MTSSIFVGGPHVMEFEESWASYCETRHAGGVADGTDAIELVLVALGIGPGDEVIARPTRSLRPLPPSLPRVPRRCL